MWRLPYGHRGVLSGVVDQNLRWYAVKLFERDEKTEAHFKFKADTKNKINEIVKL